MPLALFAAYPLLVHLSIMLAQPLLGWVALQCLYCGVFLGPLRAGRAGAWIGLLAFGAATLVLSRIGGGLYALYVPALALPGLAFAAFAGSLRPGQTALVSRIAQLERGELPPPLQRYTRRITWLWALCLAALWLTTAALTLFGSEQAWSLFTNVLSYALIGSLFLGEYVYRRWRFREYDHPGFFGHLRLVIRSQMRR